MQCPHCPKRYTHPNSYHRHVNNECIAVEPKFACEDCGSRFRRKSYVRDHNCPVYDKTNVLSSHDLGHDRFFFFGFNNRQGRKRSFDSCKVVGPPSIVVHSVGRVAK